MFRHTVLFVWKPDTTEQQVQKVRDELAALSQRLDYIRAFACGSDVGLRDDNFDFAVVADFDDADAYRRYAQDEGHRQLITDHISPILGQRAGVQFEY